MTEATLLEIETMDWEGALVLVAFPSTGSAASIAGHYLRQHLDLPLVGSLFVQDQLPIVAVEDGIATSPVRIYGGQVECKVGGGVCPSVYLITTDLVLDPPLMQRMAAPVLERAKTASLVLCLDAVVREEGDDTPDVFAAAADSTVLARLHVDGVESLEDALIGGMTGEILLKARPAGTPAGALVVEATQGVPDGRAAAALIQAVGRLVPNVPMDPKPLLEEAMQLEEQIEEAQKRAERSQHPATRQLGTFI